MPSSAAAAGELRTRDLAMGRLLRAVFETGAWRALGYSSFDRYVRERLGMSRSAAQAKLALARTCGALPELAAALEDGRIGMAGATMIGRVAEPRTASAWVSRAAERTVKHLREEIDAAGLTARMSGAHGPLAPPDDATVTAAQDLERAVLAGEPLPAIPMSVARVGRVPLRVTVAPDIADLWMAVRDMYGRLGGDRRSFVAALSGNIVRHWTPETRADRPFEAVYRRDRYRCANPTCDRREVGAHHIVFRAHGGGDAPDNLITLCGTCHVDGVHAGRITVTGRAPAALRWDLGRVVTVGGRTRRGVRGTCRPRPRCAGR